MPTVHFRGRVLPSALQITIEGLSPLISKEVGTGEIMQLSVKVIESRISVECAVDHYGPGDDISIMHTRATHVARAILDCFAFANGFGLIVFLDEMEDVDGIVRKVLLRHDELPAYFTAFRNADASVDYDAMYRLILTDPNLSLAINDLIVAVTVPAHIAINCARSIEALRNILVPEESKRKQGWAELREALRLEKSYIEFITTASTGPRHGTERYLPTQDIHKEVMKRSWVIMNRFLEYRKRGNQLLPLVEFPVLQ
jgi:hypothetical protein